MGFKMFGDSSSQIETVKSDAIDRALAVIKFALDGTILSAKENFLKAMGYRLDEIKGTKQSMFVDWQEAPSSRFREQPGMRTAISAKSSIQTFLFSGKVICRTAYLN